MRRAGAVLMCVALARGGALDSAAEQRFRSVIEVVQVDVTVTLRGNVVTGLTAADFTVRDRGIIQSVTAVSADRVPLHLLLVLDTSSSLRSSQLVELKKAAAAAVASLRPSDGVTLLTFSHDVHERASPSDPRSTATEVLDGLTAYGSTSLHDAIFSALVLRHGDVRKPVAIVFSDGEDTSSWLEAGPLLEEAMRSDVPIFAVSPMPIDGGAGRMGRDQLPREASRAFFNRNPQMARTALLTFLTEDTGGALLKVQSTNDLSSTFVSILNNFRTRYVLSYTPSGVDVAGWHPIQVRVNRRNVEVRARPGYARPAQTPRP